MRVGGQGLTFAVIPAQAGTHTNMPLLLMSAASHREVSDYGSPLYAGTTPVELDHPNNSASLVMNGSSVMSRRSGVTAMRLSASAEMSVPSAGGWPRMRT
jgi:hypothetical protein